MKVAKGKWLWRVLGAGALAVLIGLLGFFSLPWWLVTPAETRPAEVILHLALSDRSEADEYVAELYHQGLARQIVCLSTQVAWQVYPADYARRHLIALGVPAENVLTHYLPFMDCRAEALALIVAFVKQRGWRSVLLVVDPTLSGRHKRLAGPLFAREQIKFAVTYAPRDHALLLDHWWREHWKTQRLTNEAIDMVVDLFYAKCR